MTARFTAGPGTLLGPGDDAAVVRALDRRVVATTDMLVEGRHFRRDWCTGRDVGHKAAAANLADIAAMGAVPTALLVAIGCPADLPVAWAEALADGLRDECGRVGADVVGGDISESAVVVLGVTALGDLGGRAPVTRAGARPGDTVAYAGRLGWAACGLAVLGRGFRSPVAVVDAYRRPDPPYREGLVAAEYGATAMCDVSDGLVRDLGHIAAASGVGVDLETAALDLPPKLRDVGQALGMNPAHWVLGGGEDHALVATFPGGVPEGWRRVGRVTDGTGVLVDGEPYHGPAGFDHFAAPN